MRFCKKWAMAVAPAGSKEGPIVSSIPVTSGRSVSVDLEELTVEATTVVVLMFAAGILTLGGAWPDFCQLRYTRTIHIVPTEYIAPSIMVASAASPAAATKFLAAASMPLEKLEAAFSAIYGGSRQKEEPFRVAGP
jgi:hypothetical protein